MDDMPNWNRLVAFVLSGESKEPDKKKGGEGKVTFTSTLTSEKGGEQHGKE